MVKAGKKKKAPTHTPSVAVKPAKRPAEVGAMLSIIDSINNKLDERTTKVSKISEEKVKKTVAIEEKRVRRRETKKRHIEEAMSEIKQQKKDLKKQRKKEAEEEREHKRRRKVSFA
eukprot:m51a1_g7182 hypothetical protein (116) ;mRNA; r:84956-85439